MNNIFATVKKIAKKYSSNDPFELCSALDVIVTITDLPVGINGFYNNVLGFPFIYLNNQLNECELRAVCAHELGHMLLHPHMNTLYIKMKTIINGDRLEREADIFAACLLIPNAIQIGDQTVTVQQLAYELHVPSEVIEVKLAL